MPTGEDRIRNIGDRLGQQGDSLDQDRVRQVLATKRSEMFDHATRLVDRMRHALLDRVVNLAGSASLNSDKTAVRLGDAELSLPSARRAEIRSLSHDGGPPPFDVIAFTEVTIRTQPDRSGYEGRSHSLWYCDARTAGEYHWYETAFMVAPGFRTSRSIYPFALSPDREAAGALAVVFDTFEVALPFVQADQEAQEDFTDRWLNYLADAVEGRLRLPVRMPERNPKGTWRRAAP